MSPPSKKPPAVTRLGILVLIFTSWHIYRLITISQEWAQLERLPLTLSPYFLVLEALLWALAGLLMLWSLRAWPGRFRTRMLLALSIYWIWHIGREMLLRSRGLASVNFRFELGLLLVVSIAIIWTINRKSAILYFGELDERQQED